MFSCMDTRVMTTKLLQADDGEMFIIRNPGNLVPHASQFGKDTISPEPGALEFAILGGGCANVFVCGHSDCKVSLAFIGHEVSKEFKQFEEEKDTSRHYKLLQNVEKII